MGFVRKSFAALALAGVGALAYDFGSVGPENYERVWNARARHIEEKLDTKKVAYPYPSDPASYGHAVSGNIDDPFSLHEGESRSRLLERIKRATPDQAGQLEAALRRPRPEWKYDYHITVLRIGVDTLARIGGTEILRRLSDENASYLDYHARKKLEEIDPEIREGMQRLKRNAARWNTGEAFFAHGHHPPEAFIYKGTEDALQEIINRGWSKLAAVFVNMYYDKSFIMQYRHELIPLIEKGMKNRNGYFDCDAPIPEFVNSGHALSKLDPEYAGKLAGIVKEDCDYVWYYT